MVYIIDYTSRSLPYDTHLISSILRKKKDIKFVCETYTGNEIVDSITIHGFFNPIKFKFEKGKFNKIKKGIKYFITLIYIYFLFKKNDIAHFQWMPLIESTKFEIFYIKLLKNKGVKILYTAHNVLPHDTGDKYFEIYKKVYKNVDSIICHTESSKKTIVNKFEIDENKISVINHGPLYLVEKNNFKSKMSLDSNIGILFGRIEKYKGYDTLLQAINYKKSSFLKERIKIKIVGKADNNERQYISNFIKTNKLDEIIYTKFGYLSDNNLHEEIVKSSVILLPYKNITQSGVLYTAINYKKPIIASRLKGFVEIFNDSIVYFDVDDYKSLSDEIIKIFTDESLYKEYENKSKKASSMFNWKEISNKTTHLYNVLSN